MFPKPAPENVNALWLSRNGNPLTRETISKRIKERIGRRTGKRFSAHMFRHAAVTYVVDVAPEQARMITGLLGHAGFRTAKRHYIKGQQHMAVIKYQAAVGEVMGRGRTKSAPARRPRDTTSSSVKSATAGMSSRSVRRRKTQRRRRASRRRARR
jgi:hypothetical protein